VLSNFQSSLTSEELDVKIAEAKEKQEALSAKLEKHRQGEIKVDINLKRKLDESVEQKTKVYKQRKKLVRF
jgi:hypothetical protein